MKPWEDPARFLKWAVFERIAQMNPRNDMIIFGQFQSEAEAAEAMDKWCPDNDNYYVKQYDVRDVR